MKKNCIGHDPRNCRLCARLRHPSQAKAGRAWDDLRRQVAGNGGETGGTR